MKAERDTSPELRRFDHCEKMREKIRRRLRDVQVAAGDLPHIRNRIDRADRALAAARADVDRIDI